MSNQHLILSLLGQDPIVVSFSPPLDPESLSGVASALARALAPSRQMLDDCTATPGELEYASWTPLQPN